MVTKPVFQLPHASNRRCLDRFSVLEDEDEGDDGLVPFWKLLRKILEAHVADSKQLIELLDTVSNVLRGSSGVAGDYGALRQAVDDRGPAFLERTWPKIIAHALRLPEHFPAGGIPVLSPGLVLEFSRAQVACLVVHQFLCTLESPPWRDGYFDFSIWYASQQRHPQAVDMYFAALLDYLEALPDDMTDQSEPGSAAVVYSLHEYPRHAPPHAPLSQITVETVEEYDTSLQELSRQGEAGAVVVSANKHIGFGQSATQEEMYVGNCPEACPAVLVTPPLQDDQSLTIDGASPMLRISGQRRNIRWKRLEATGRQGGRLLFMDALEIDELDDSHGLPDLQPLNIEREIHKAYTAFSSWQPSADGRVFTGIWGCGAFNGDPGVKMVILWIAASLAGRRLVVVCDGSHGDFPRQLRQMVDLVPTEWTSQKLQKLLGMTPLTAERTATMEVMISLLHSA